MTQEINEYSMKFFNSLSDTLNAYHTELESLDTMTQERQKKYQQALTSYQKYIQRQSQMLQKNKTHCQLRNTMYLDEAKKAWRVGISNRTLVLKSMARTNIVKNDADKWVENINQNLLQERLDHSNYSRKPEDPDLSGSNLINKYNQILHQYNMK